MAEVYTTSVSKATLDAVSYTHLDVYKRQDMDWEEEGLGEMEGGYDNDRFSCYWDDDTEVALTEKYTNLKKELIL